MDEDKTVAPQPQAPGSPHETPLVKRKPLSPGLRLLAYSLLLACVLLPFKCAQDMQSRPAEPVVARPPQAAAPNSESEVWVNDRTGFYYRRGSRWYGETASGHFSSEAEAVTDGHQLAEDGQ